MSHKNCLVITTSSFWTIMKTRVHYKLLGDISMLAGYLNISLKSLGHGALFHSLTLLRTMLYGTMAYKLPGFLQKKKKIPRPINLLFYVSPACTLFQFSWKQLQLKKSWESLPSPTPQKLLRLHDSSKRLPRENQRFFWQHFPMLIRGVNWLCTMFQSLNVFFPLILASSFFYACLQPSQSINMQKRNQKGMRPIYPAAILTEQTWSL